MAPRFPECHKTMYIYAKLYSFHPFSVPCNLQCALYPLYRLLQCVLPSHTVALQWWLGVQVRILFSFFSCKRKWQRTHCYWYWLDLLNCPVCEYVQNQWFRHRLIYIKRNVNTVYLFFNQFFQVRNRIRLAGFVFMQNVLKNIQGRCLLRSGYHQASGSPSTDVRGKRI